MNNLRKQVACFPLRVQLGLGALMLASLFITGAVYGETVRDEFNAIAYDGSDGTIDWSPKPWQELGESDGCSAGYARVVSSIYAASGNCMFIDGKGSAGIGLSREADLSTATSATLTFSYRRYKSIHTPGVVDLEVSDDGGSNWTTLQTYTINATDVSNVHQSFDISSYTASNTQIRFQISITSGVGSIKCGLYVDNIQLEYAIPPDIIMLKSVQTFSDPYNGETNPKAIPGATTLYTIIATKQGGGATDADTVVITDPIPANTELFVGDINGAGSGPILFQDGTPISGLTYTFTSLDSAIDDVEFSNDGGTTYTYTPVPDGDGFDSNVTNFRATPGGTFNASDGSNHPSFTLKFKVRVK